MSSSCQIQPPLLPDQAASSVHVEALVEASTMIPSNPGSVSSHRKYCARQSDIPLRLNDDAVRDQEFVLFW